MISFEVTTRDCPCVRERDFLPLPVEISRATYEVALDVFQHSRLVTQRHPYEQVVVPPPQE
jgi:hypothetical protein